MSKVIELGTIEYTNKSDYLEKAIIGGNKIGDALKYWDENLKGEKAGGFRAMFYDALRDGDMNKAEVKAYCEEHGSSNDAKQYTHYVTIADLVRDTRK